MHAEHRRFIVATYAIRYWRSHANVTRTADVEPSAILFATQIYEQYQAMYAIHGLVERG